MPTVATPFVRRVIPRLISGLILIVMSYSLMGCSSAAGASRPSQDTIAAVALGALEQPSQSTQKQPSELATATFAGGCFWCMEQPFDGLPGVTQTISGYTGGTVEDPTYYQVSNGDTGHVEAMQVTYDPAQVTYDTLLDTFWHNIDPLDDRGQFCDKGSQYRSAIFYASPEQQTLAEETKAAIADKFDQPVATDILPEATFYPAEDYHQNYYQTRPVRYKVYRYGCGRDQRLSELWGAEAPSHD